LAFLKKRYFAVIGLALFAWILWNANLPEVLSRIASLNVGFLAIAVILGISTLAIKGYRWKLLCGAVGSGKSKPIPAVKAAGYFTIGFFWSIITPGRIGDFVRAVYAKPFLGSLSAGLSSVVIDRLIDVIFLFGLGAIAIVSFSFIFGSQIMSFSVLALLLVLLAFAVWLFFQKRLMKALLRPFFKALVPKGKKEVLAEGFSNFYSSLSGMRSKKMVLAKAVLLAVLSWAVSIISAYFLSLAFGFRIPLEFFVLVVPILGILDLVPISISGIGTRDAALIFLFSFYGISAESAIAFSIVYLFAFYWFVGFIGAVLFCREPVKIEI